MVYTGFPQNGWKCSDNVQWALHTEVKEASLIKRATANRRNNFCKRFSTCLEFLLYSESFKDGSKFISFKTSLNMAVVLLTNSNIRTWLRGFWGDNCFLTKGHLKSVSMPMAAAHSSECNPPQSQRQWLVGCFVFSFYAQKYFYVLKVQMSSILSS